MNVEEKVETLVSYITDKTQKEKEKILNEAKQKASKIKADYEKEAQKTYEDIVSQAKRESEYYYNKNVERAVYETKRELIKVNHELLDTLISDLEKKAKSIPSSSNYPQLLYKMICEAIETLNKNEVLLKFNKNDKSTFKNMEDKIKSKYKNIVLEVSDEELPIIFGVHVCSRDQHMIVKNTAKEKIGEHKSDIATIFFEMIQQEIG